jgi:sec-independent protein translocase protein TatB
MFDIGYGELLLIAIVALLVLGPDKLPGALRTAGLWISRLRRSFDRVRAEIEQEVGADDIRRQIHNEMMLDQAREIRREIEAATQEMKDGVQAPIADMPDSRSAALARAGAVPDAGGAPAAAGPAAAEPASAEAASSNGAGIGTAAAGGSPAGSPATAAASSAGTSTAP